MWQPGTALVFLSKPVRAGRSGAVLRATRSLVHRRVEGFVTGPDGAAIAGAQIAVRYATEFSADGSALLDHGGPAVTSDLRGRFELSDVPIELAWLRIDAPGHGAQHYPVESIDRGGDLRIALATPSGRWLRVVCHRRKGAVKMTVRDAGGRTLRIGVVQSGKLVQRSGNKRRSSRQFPPCWIPSHAHDVWVDGAALPIGGDARIGRVTLRR